MARVQHSPGSDTQEYSSSDAEEWEKDEKEAHEEHEEQEEGAAVTGAATTDLAVGNVTGAGGKQVKKRKCLVSTSEEEVQRLTRHFLLFLEVRKVSSSTLVLNHGVKENLLSTPLIFVENSNIR